MAQIMEYFYGPEKADLRQPREGLAMRDFDAAGTALAVALGFSAKETEAHARLLCRGDDTNAGQVVLIVEVRVQPRKAPLVSGQEKGPPRVGQGTKGPGKPMTPHKSLLQSIVD